MKISLAWLKTIVDVPWSVEKTAEKLVHLGFEVDQIIRTGLSIDNIISVQIKQVDKHPNADRLPARHGF